VGTDLRRVLAELRQRRRSLPYRELLRLMRSVGCEVTKTQEGCRITHPAVRGFVATVARPHGPGARRDVREPYVKNCIRLLEQVVEAKEGAHEEQRI
jgi:hypothetical protein